MILSIAILPSLVVIDPSSRLPPSLADACLFFYWGTSVVTIRVATRWPYVPLPRCSALYCGNQVTARVTNPPPLKVPCFDSFVDSTCLEDQEKKGGFLFKVSGMETQVQALCPSPQSATQSDDGGYKPDRLNVRDRALVRPSSGCVHHEGATP